MESYTTLMKPDLFYTYYKLYFEKERILFIKVRGGLSGYLADRAQNSLLADFPKLRAAMFPMQKMSEIDRDMQLNPEIQLSKRINFAINIKDIISIHIDEQPSMHTVWTYNRLPDNGTLKIFLKDRFRRNFVIPYTDNRESIIEIFKSLEIPVEVKPYRR